uniref:Poly(RC)-binding protein 3 n=1 Tax=Cacopsylla melanoneura TaxID=428564 RepID=A0A8D9BMT1_9HEMI
MDCDNLTKDLDSTESHITVRLIMQGKEVGSIIGKKGEIVKRFREESGAKINISDGSCPERVVTVTGSTTSLLRAFGLITKKFEEFHELQNNHVVVGGGQPLPTPGTPASSSPSPITFRLIVPASQCGSLIGKGGCKIKEIRELSGASIQVASDMLPNSTERAVTITGTAEAITQAVYQMALVMMESPPKGATIPYRPKPQVAPPLLLAGGQAYTIHGNYAVPTPTEVSVPVSLHGGLIDSIPASLFKQAALPPHHLLQSLPTDIGSKLSGSPLAGLTSLGLGGIGSGTTALNPAALAALAGSQLRTTNPPRTPQPPTTQSSSSTQEMTVPNDLIGCIIGKGGTKIFEIRQISGAMIRISNAEEREANSTDRTITISGNPDSVALAQYLINMRISMETAGMPMGGYHYLTPNHIVKASIH